MADPGLMVRRRSDGKQKPITQAQWDSLTDEQRSAYELVDAPETVKVTIDEDTVEMPKAEAEEYRGVEGAVLEPVIRGEQFSPAESAGLGAVEAGSMGLAPLAASHTASTPAGMLAGPMGRSLPLVGPAVSAVADMVAAGEEDPRMAERGVGATEVVPEIDRAREAGQQYMQQTGQAFEQNPKSFIGGGLLGALATSAAPGLPGAGISRSLQASGVGRVPSMLTSATLMGAGEGAIASGAEAAVADMGPVDALAHLAGGAAMGGLLAPVAALGLEGLAGLGRFGMGKVRKLAGHGDDLEILEQGGGSTAVAPGGIRPVPAEAARKKANLQEHIGPEGVGAEPSPRVSVEDQAAGDLAPAVLQHLRGKEGAIRSGISQEARAFHMSPKGQQKKSLGPVVEEVEKLVAKLQTSEGKDLPLGKVGDYEAILDKLTMVPDSAYVKPFDRTAGELRMYRDALEQVAAEQAAQVNQLKMNARIAGYPTTRADIMKAASKAEKRAAEAQREIKSIDKAMRQAERVPVEMNAQDADKLLSILDEAAGFARRSGEGELSGDFVRIGAKLRQVRQQWGEDWAAVKERHSNQLGELHDEKFSVGIRERNVPSRPSAAIKQRVSSAIKNNSERERVFGIIREMDAIPPSEQPRWWREMLEMKAARDKPGKFETYEEVSARRRQGPAMGRFAEMRGDRAGRNIRGTGGAKGMTTMAGAVETGIRAVDPAFRLVYRLGMTGPNAMGSSVARALASPSEVGEAMLDEIPPEGMEMLRAWKRAQDEEQ